MRGEDLHYILQPSTVPYPRTRNAFPHIPIASKESSWSSIQRIPDHTALFNRPFRQYCQSATKYTTVIELPIRQNVFRFFPYALVVLLRPAFL